MLFTKTKLLCFQKFNLSEYAFGKNRQFCENNPQHLFSHDSSRRTSVASSTYEDERKVVNRAKPVQNSYSKPLMGNTRNRSQFFLIYFIED